MRCPLALHALSKTLLTLVDSYPVASQDFNATENAWRTVQQRLDETMPIQLEGRDAFIKRLRAAVQWVNNHKAQYLWRISTNQKERADECLATKPPGGRTTW